MKNVVFLCGPLLLAFLPRLVASEAEFTAPFAKQPDSSRTQYILFNRAPGQGMYQGIPETLGRRQFEEVLARFPNRPAARIQTGLSYVFSCFRTAPETTLAALKLFLQTAEETTTPILVQIDTEHWWDARPDLWNWWDPAQPGYDPANRENVERTGWSPEQAIKIAWRNWGRQIRVLPPPNLASPRYTAACREEVRRITSAVMTWHERLPPDSKHLLIGIKLGHETSIGVNAYYYPNGNDLLAQPASRDPVHNLDTADVLARGMVQLGYAALTSSGIRTQGVPTESELRDVAQQYLQMLCQEAVRAGVPRRLLFAHGAGWKEGELSYDVPLNCYACPAWSFYKHATDPRLDVGVQRNLARSDAPYWAATEWLLQGPRESVAWQAALGKTLSDSRCRYVCIFNWESIRTSEPALQAVAELVDTSEQDTQPRPPRPKVHASDSRASRRDSVLTLPTVSPGPPAAGKKVAVTAPEYAGTGVHHMLYLPPDWQPDWKTTGRSWPVVVEYTGNRAPTLGSTGRVEDAALGYGVSGGRFIWVVLPYVNQNGDDNALTWWGDEEATAAYAKTNVPRICAEYGGDPRTVFLCGFSRGAIGTNYIGLHDDDIARLWCAFISHDHYDGVREWHGTTWGTPLATYRAGAIRRLQRLQGRSVLVCENRSTQATEDYLADHLPCGQFTFLSVPVASILGPFPNEWAKHPHTDRWLRKDSRYRRQVWQWVDRVAARATG